MTLSRVTRESTGLLLQPGVIEATRIFDGERQGWFARELDNRGFSHGEVGMFHVFEKLGFQQIENGGNSSSSLPEKKVEAGA